MRYITYLEALELLGLPVERYSKKSKTLWVTGKDFDLDTGHRSCGEHISFNRCDKLAWPDFLKQVLVVGHSLGYGAGYDSGYDEGSDQGYDQGHLNGT